MDAVREIRSWRVNGILMLVVEIGLFLVALVILREALLDRAGLLLLVSIVMLILGSAAFPGFFIVQPNEARILVFLGRYVGTVRDSGFWWSNPFAVKRHVSLRIHNFNSERIKVNDLQGNPIEIAAVVVWRVVDSARALFDVENYIGFVGVQSETAIRTLAAQYPYDAHDDAKASSVEVRRRFLRSCGWSWRPDWTLPGSRSLKPASAIWRTRRRSRRPCCGDNRRKRLLPPGRKSWKVP